MGTFEVYRHPILQKYRAAHCSKAAAFQLFTLVLTIICPLLVTYRSQGFWLKTRTYEEQPEITFLYDYIFILSGREPEEYLVWSSFGQLNEMEQARLRVPLIKFRPIDYNRDRKADEFELTAQFPMTESENIHGVQALLFFDYRLQLYSKFQMRLRVPVESITYYAGFWELLKWAWVQYVAILPIFVLGFGAVRRFVFQNRILITIPQKPVIAQ